MFLYIIHLIDAYTFIGTIDIFNFQGDILSKRNNERGKERERETKTFLFSIKPINIAKKHS